MVLTVSSESAIISRDLTINSSLTEPQMNPPALSYTLKKRLIVSIIECKLCSNRVKISLHHLVKFYNGN